MLETSETPSCSPSSGSGHRQPDPRQLGMTRSGSGTATRPGSTCCPSFPITTAAPGLALKQLGGVGALKGCFFQTQRRGMYNRNRGRASFARAHGRTSLLLHTNPAVSIFGIKWYLGVGRPHHLPKMGPFVLVKRHWQMEARFSPQFGTCELLPKLWACSKG